MNEKQLEKMIKDVLLSMTNNGDQQKQVTRKREQLTVEDYPIQDKRPDLIRTPTNKTLDDITMKDVMNNTVTPADLRISPKTLESQAEVAESAGRDAFANNLRRAAELTTMPDDKVLDIYNALRPNRSTKEELLIVADELEQKYDATINADFVREAADIYADRGILRVE